jgi:ABC-2 type transport system permease protein
MKTELKSTPATALTKYMQICGLEWKNALSYRGDTWLSAIFSIFSILLAYLLWSAIFAGRPIFGGMTLKQMTTYYLLAGIISSLTQSDDLLWEFSDDIKSGKFVKYLVRPVSPLACFLSAGFARSFLPAISSLIVLACSMAIFKNFFVIPSLTHVLSALPVILLGTLLSSLLNYIGEVNTFSDNLLSH